MTWNQSMVQQLISEGNMRNQLQKESPMGLIARTNVASSITRRWWIEIWSLYTSH